MSDELIYQLSLELIPGIGQRGAKQLLSYCGSASEVFSTSKHALLKIPGIGQKTVNSILSNSSFKEAEKIILSCEKENIRILHYTNSNYPDKLKLITDAPSIIYFKGNGEPNPSRLISIVGTRKASEYGKEITEKIVESLSKFNTTIVSGLAYGIDIKAHKSALGEKIPTFAVIAGGIDRIYPSTHKKYAQEMQEFGGIITESIPGTRPNAHLFPVRNRIIAGISDATIVVEAAQRGGALITAHLADSYGRMVFAVPGDIGNSLSEGTNKLIATQKAHIYTGIEDLIYHLGWSDETLNHTKNVDITELSDGERKLYLYLTELNKPEQIDLISIKTQISINQVASLLLELEFKNLVRSLPGKKYQAK